MHSSAFIFKWIFIILAGNKDNHNSLNGLDFLQNSNTNYWVSCPWVFEKCCDHSSVFIFDWILFIRACNKDSYKSLDESQIRQDLICVYGVSCPWTSEKISIDLKWEKCREQFGAFIFEWIFIILAGNKDTHWNEFEFLPDPITNYWVSCPWVLEYWMYNVVSTLAPSFLTGSYSFFHVTRIVIKAWMGLKLGKIWPGFTELAALERLKNLHRLIIGEMLWAA